MADVWSLGALQVLSLFQGGAALHGYAVMERTKLPVSSVYTILGSLEKRGLLRSETERVDPHISRRVAKVTYHGTTAADDQLAAIRALVAV